MDTEYELQTHQVEDQHWWYRGRRRVLAEVLRSLELAPHARILDAGCGSGRNMVELAAFGQVTGVELAPASVEVARGRGVGEVIAGSVVPLPLADSSFDLVVSLDVIEHLDDDREALREFRRVTAPGGRLLITVPAYQWLWSMHDEVNHHRRRYTRRTLLSAAAEAGWRPLRTTHFNALLLPGAIAVRSLERVKRPSGPPVSDLQRTPDLLNRVLERPLHAEAAIIRRGRRIPAGLSLLAVFA
ncbi:MAG TPA: class I SAM-dependent methyltransferase [Solirubrobacteraceae bacterium]|jgi:SAM-dependent methyltransferase|nr:class I SAM-dependent methyltransferase [Solirubrobacteraceae bacterium]